MDQTSLKFGTSGLRGLSAELSGRPAFAYTTAFLNMLAAKGHLLPGEAVYLGMDLRPSSPEIAALCMGAIKSYGFAPIFCGALPTPALAYCAIQRHQAPLIVVTGSHIPYDRNGLKFYRRDGEINKQDERDISSAYASLPDSLPLSISSGENQHSSAHNAFLNRYLDFLEPDSLQGLRIGLYQHTSVARDMLIELLELLGASVTPFGRADEFVPVDTEALRPEDIALLSAQASQNDFDVIISTDGDADRPLIADEHGTFIRGDLVGAITARWLGADTIVAPVTANSALEDCGAFAQVIRTRVGSPYVIDAMSLAAQNKGNAIVGFEANGGVLLGSDIEKHGKMLTALPTRDSFLPIIACLLTIADTGHPLSSIASDFQFRTALSDRLQDIPNTKSSAFLARLTDMNSVRHLFPHYMRSDLTDGVKLQLDAGRMVHYRASGNAPELRCYVEAESQDAAQKLLHDGLAIARQATLEGN